MKNKPIKTLKEIKEAIAGLSPDKYLVFRVWFEKFSTRHLSQSSKLKNIKFYEDPSLPLDEKDWPRKLR